MAGCALERARDGQGHGCRPRGAVVPQVFGQDQAQLMLAGDQQPVQDLPAQGADGRLPARDGNVENPDPFRRTKAHHWVQEIRSARSVYGMLA